jgi:8-oxo-dGTP pyrophosphatase MutT (NUDIX family)
LGEAAAGAVSTADFERRARARLDLVPPADLSTAGGLGGDHALDGVARPSGPPRPAAVLVGIVAHAEVPTVLLTQRRHGLRTHSGQIAFPGGKIDAEDGSPCAAALREAREEVGLSARHIDAIGYLDPYLTGTGYIVVPVVALIAPPVSLDLNPHEVAEAFEVPLQFLMDPANHQRHHQTFDGRRRTFYAMPYEARFIWGATAGILRHLFERLYG